MYDTQTSVEIQESSFLVQFDHLNSFFNINVRPTSDQTIAKKQRGRPRKHNVTIPEGVVRHNMDNDISPLEMTNQKRLQIINEFRNIRLESDSSLKEIIEILSSKHRFSYSQIHNVISNNI